MDQDKIPKYSANSTVTGEQPWGIGVSQVASILGIPADQIPPNAKIERPSKIGWQVRGPETQPFPGVGEVSKMAVESAMESVEAGVVRLNWGVIHGRLWARKSPPALHRRADAVA